MRIPVVLLLAFFHEATSHTQYPRKKKYESAGGEWDDSPLPKRHGSIRPNLPKAKEDAVVSPDGSVQVEAVVRSTSQGGGAARPIREHLSEKSMDAQVLRAATAPEPSNLRTGEAASVEVKGNASASTPEVSNLSEEYSRLLSQSKAPIATPADATILIYDTIAQMEESSSTDSEQVILLQEQVSAVGWTNKVVGAGSKWQGWGSKLTAMLEELRKLDPQEFVIISDSRDVVVNTAPGGMRAFLKNFKALTGDRPGAVVVSSEGSCCAAAMNVVGEPGKLIGPDGSRSQRSCSSGIGDCLHRGPEFDLSWKTFFKEIAENRGFKNTPFPYLNAGILAGYAGDVVRVYEFLQVQPREDDQALLSEAMYRRPDWFVVDYDQRMLGSNSQQGCQYEWHTATDLKVGYFRNRATGWAPLFIQTSGHFTECYLEKITK